MKHRFQSCRTLARHLERIIDLLLSHLASLATYPPHKPNQKVTIQRTKQPTKAHERNQIVQPIGIHALLVQAQHDTNHRVPNNLAAQQKHAAELVLVEIGHVGDGWQGTIGDPLECDRGEQECAGDLQATRVEVAANGEDA